MTGTDLVVAIGREQQRASAVNAATDEFEQIERGLIRPVHVFEYAYRGRLTELAEKAAENHLTRRFRVECATELAIDALGDVVQRAERPWCEQGLTAAAQDTRRRDTCQKRIYQTGLADTGFAEDERDATAFAARCLFKLQQSPDQFVPFEQHLVAHQAIP